MTTSRRWACAATIAVLMAHGDGPINVTAFAQQDNGISVGDPKIFDNRALALMLESLNESLRTTTVIDAAKLAATFGNLQGFQQETIQRSFSLQGAPLPGVVDTSKITGGQENLTGGTTSTTTTQPAGTVSGTVTTSESEKATSGAETTQQTTTAARSPVTPALPGVLAAPTFSPQFGPNGGDLLTDQVNLTYQIVNLRLLLDRALTDRLYEGSPRLQAVLGFNVSIDPPRDSQDSAAFVEITLTTDPAKEGEPVSIVGVMPQEKTYNSAALSNRSNAFGGSAVASVFSVGYNEQRQSQTFYLYRDNDTIAFERMNDTAKETTFGWSFRPVLGRRSVSPGARQMFAVISLPYKDAEAADVPLRVAIKTYWRHFDRKLKTASHDRTFWQDMARGFSLGLAQDRPHRAQVEVDKVVKVPTILKYQEGLTPKVESVEWDLLGDSNAMVRVRGRNFFQGTEVRLGTSRFLSPADGLTLKSDKAFDVIAPTAALMTNGFVVGRYGSAEPLLNAAGHDLSSGVTIRGVSFKPALGGRSLMDIRVRRRDGAPLDLSKLPGPALIRINDAIVPPPYNLVPNGSGQLESIRLYVPEATQTSGLLTVRFPFGTDRWAASFRIHDPSAAISILRFAPEGDKDTTTKLLITTNDQDNLFECEASGNGPTRSWQISLGQNYPVGTRPPGATADPVANRRAPRQIEFRPPTSALDKHPLLLIDCEGTVHPVAIPPAAPKPAPTTFASVAPATVKVHDARKVTITGTLLDRVATVTASGYRLDSRAVDGKTLEVFLTRALTEHAGTITLICRDDKGAILGSIDLTVL